MVESKLRLLVQKLELVEGIELAHPYVKTFEDGFCAKIQKKFLQLLTRMALWKVNCSLNLFQGLIALKGRRETRKQSRGTLDQIIYWVKD